MSDNYQPRWVIVDDTDARIQYYGPSWFQDQGSRDDVGNFGPAYRSTLRGTNTNASLSFAFSGLRVNVTGSNNPPNDSGVLDTTWECFIDNISIGRFPPYPFPENDYRFCVTEEDLVDGPHVITVNVTVFNEQTFWLDTFKYVPSPGLLLDNEAVLVDNVDSAMEFGSGWKPYADIANITTVPNSSLTFSFVGTSLTWYAVIPAEYPHSSATGIYSVDEGDAINFPLKGLLPTNSTTTIYTAKLFETNSYPAGPHEIVVTFLGTQQTTPLVLNHVIVQNGTFSTTTISPGVPSISITGLSSSNTSSRSTGGSHASSSGPTIGGVVGGLVLLTIAVVIFYYFRRWKKQKYGYVDQNTDSDIVVEPFHTGGPNTALPSIVPSQTFTKLNSVAPPKSSPRPRKSQNTNFSPQHQSPSSMPLSIDGSITAINDSRTHNNTTRISSSRRVIHHEDSGVRLLGDVRESEVVEIPPVYTFI